jgi:hypothetical protein
LSDVAEGDELGEVGSAENNIVPQARDWSEAQA